MCTAIGQLELGSVEQDPELVRTALAALAATPGVWGPGNDARRALSKYFELIWQRHRDTGRPAVSGSPDAVAQATALEEARAALRRLEARTGEQLSCTIPARPS